MNQRIDGQPSSEVGVAVAPTLKHIADLNAALHTLMDQDPRIVILGEDILDPYGGAFKATKGLSTKFPTRVFTTPISESAIVGIGAGLAMRGFRPIVEIMFGDFLSLAFDQLLNSATKFSEMYNGQVDCPLIIRTPMGARRGYGPTHSQSLEKFFCGMPGLTVIAPSPFLTATTLYQTALNTPGVKLIVENKVMYGRDLQLPINGRLGDFSVKVSSSPYPAHEFSLTNFARADLTLLAYGGMAEMALSAALAAYLDNEVAVDVIVPTQIAPFDPSLLARSLTGSKKLLIVEEGTEPWGVAAEWGFQAQERYFHSLALPVKRLASTSLIVPSAKSAEALALVQEGDILEAISQMCG